MFLQACMILFTGGGLVLGGVPGPGGMPGGDPPGMATAAGGTHPTLDISHGESNKQLISRRHFITEQRGFLLI